MTLIDRLDAAAEKTGIPAFATRPHMPRRLRWLPLVALLAGLTGYVFVVARPGAHTPGLIALSITLSLSVWLPMVGPLGAITGQAGADEFDRQRAMRSYLVGLAWAVFFAFTALLATAGFTLLLNWTREMLLAAMIATIVMMMLIVFAVPTLHASWTLPDSDGDD